MDVKTPYYLIDENKLLRNLKIIKKVRELSQAKSLLALKCFSTWSVFKLMSQYMDGTTASSPYEARLGYEKFGKEVQVYSVGFSKEDIQEVSPFADKIIFNSLSQLDAFYSYARRRSKIGVRINPSVRYSNYDLADPARRFSRLGVVDKSHLLKSISRISGVMFHFNCENSDFKNLSSNLDYISEQYGYILRQLEWVSLGGGIYFTKADYPLDKFCMKIKEFSQRFGVQIYLEPGETAITESAELVTKVLVRNEIDIAIVDASTEAHMLDLLIYRSSAKIHNTNSGRFKYMIAGRSCLAGDVFGTYNFKSRLKIGSIIRFGDAGGYTMVKKNWFNGLKMPAIVVKRLSGKTEIIREFGYKDFLGSLS